MGQSCSCQKQKIQSNKIQQPLSTNTEQGSKFIAQLKIILVRQVLQGSGCHVDIKCDYCQEDAFRDHRYRCVICSEYNLCGDCFEQRKVNKNHQTSHPVILYKQPVPTEYTDATYDIFNKKSLGTKDLNFIVHESVSCEGCGIDPLVGLRLKCDECIDYNICIDCYKRNRVSKKHKVTHSLVVILYSDKKTFNIEDVQYDTNQILGEGHFAKVYKAQWKGRTIALKVFKIPKTDFQNNKDSFNKEVLAYSEVNSYKIIEYFGADTKIINNQIDYYIATEYMSKGTLEKAISSNEHSYRRKFQWLLTIIKGLRRLHDKGFVHKDIKSDNILLDDNLDCKIGDMGVTMHRGNEYVFYGGQAPVQYSAPEILSGQRYTYKVDIFSFGLLINFVFTGLQHSGKGANVKFITETPFFQQIVQRCISADPDVRPTAIQLENLFVTFNSSFWDVLPIPMKDYVKASKTLKDEIFIKIWNQLKQIAVIK